MIGAASNRCRRRAPGRGTGIVLSALLAVVLLACDAQSLSNLPTHREFSGTVGSPAAATEGLLVAEGGCLYLDDGVARLLPIWPTGYWLDGATLKQGSQEIAKIGVRVRLAGGSYQQLADFADLLVTPLPASCSGNGYWLVADRGVTSLGETAPSPS